MGSRLRRDQDDDVDDDGFSFLASDDVISEHKFVPLDENPCADMDMLTEAATKKEQIRAAARAQRLEDMTRGARCTADVLRSARERYAKDLEQMRMQRTCVRCGSVYKEINNFTWQCRRHPGWNSIDYAISLTYPCCGQPRDTNTNVYNRAMRYGCTRCDHVDTEDEEYPTDVLPAVLVDNNVILVEKKSIVDREPHPEDPVLTVLFLNRAGTPPNGMRI